MKLKSACVYRARTSALWVGIGMLFAFALGNPPIFLPFSLPLNAVLFFLYAFCTFQKQTNLFIQFGVSRKKQYLSFFALLPVCLLAALYMLALSRLYTQILIAFRDTFSGMNADLRALYTETKFTPFQALWSCLSCFLQNAAGLFIGYFVASILYRRKRRIHARLVKILIAIAVIVGLCALVTVVNSWYWRNTAHVSDNLFSSVVRTWINWMVLGMTVGDTTILTPLRYGLLTVAFASTDWLLLRDLPQQT